MRLLLNLSDEQMQCRRDQRIDELQRRRAFSAAWSRHETIKRAEFAGLVAVLASVA